MDTFLGIPIVFLLKVIPVLLVFGGLLSVVPILVLAERKICAWIQNREGPNRVGILGPDSPLEIFGIKSGNTRILGGFAQPLADAIKLIAKEAFIPAGADKALYILAPIFAMLPPFLSFAVIPIAPDLKIGATTILMQVADL